MSISLADLNWLGMAVVVEFHGFEGARSGGRGDRRRSCRHFQVFSQIESREILRTRKARRSQACERAVPRPAPPICEANDEPLHAIHAQPMSRCSPKHARTANKQMSLIMRTGWKYGRFSNAAVPAVIVHNGMALA